MIPLRIEGATHPDVQTLHVRVEAGCCVSRWEPTPDELVALNAGGSVELWVVGGQPVVALRAVPAA